MGFNDNKRNLNFNTGKISSKTYTWPISNTKCYKWAKSAKLPF